MPFDPERGGWRLDEAIMRLSDPEALARLARLCSIAAGRSGRPRLPPWWLEELAAASAGNEPDESDLERQLFLERDSIERAFVDRLAGGELVGWARRDSPMARYEPVPADAWPSLSGRMRLWSQEWRGGPLRLEEVKRHEPVPRHAPALVDQRDAQGRMGVRIGTRPKHRLEPVREVVLRLYSVRVQPPDGLARAGKSASEMRCRAWLADLMRAYPDAPRPKAELEEQARRTFGLGQRAFDRAWRGALEATGRAWSKPGPRNSRR